MKDFSDKTRLFFLENLKKIGERYGDNPECMYAYIVGYLYRANQEISIKFDLKYKENLIKLKKIVGIDKRAQFLFEEMTNEINEFKNRPWAKKPKEK